MYIENEIEYNSILDFLKVIDKLLPVPLSERVSLEDFAEKILSKATICAEVIDGEIISLLAGYTENLENNIAYITIVGTLPKGQRKGYSKKLIKRFIQIADSKGIKAVHLHTDKHNNGAISLYKHLGFENYVVENEQKPNDCHLIYWITKD